MQIFERLPSYSALQKKVLLLEDRISHILGGIQVGYIEELQPMLMLEEYYSVLDSFYNRVRNSRLPFHPHSLRGLQMILERCAFTKMKTVMIYINLQLVVPKCLKGTCVIKIEIGKMLKPSSKTRPNVLIHVGMILLYKKQILPTPLKRMSAPKRPQI